MKSKIFLKLSITGLALAVMSFITSTLIPDKGSKEASGHLVLSFDDLFDKWTCSQNAEGDNCDWTATLSGDNGYNGIGSRTTKSDGESYITTQNGGKVLTITTNGKHTSHC